MDANSIINKLGDQIKELSIGLAVKQAQVEELQAEVMRLRQLLPKESKEEA